MATVMERRGITLASRGDRVLGQFADGLIAFVPIGVVGLIVGMTTGRDFGPAIGLPLTLAAMLYLWFSDGMAGGQSYGKRMVGIAVVDFRTGEPCTYGQSFVRNVVLTLLNVLDWVFIFGAARRRLGDYAAGTTVIDVKPRSR